MDVPILGVRMQVVAKLIILAVKVMLLRLVVMKVARVPMALMKWQVMSQNGWQIGILKHIIKIHHLLTR